MATTAVSAPSLDEGLELVIQLNNQGAALLDEWSSRDDGRKSARDAMMLFNHALAVPNVFDTVFDDDAGGNAARLHNAGRFSRGDVSYYYRPLVFCPDEEDTVFFFFSQSIYLLPTMSSTGHTETDGSENSSPFLSSSSKRQATKMAMIALLMNTALACHKLGCSSRKESRKVALFHKAVDLYLQLARFLRELAGGPVHRLTESGTLSFFYLATLNNASWIYLQLGMTEQSQERQLEFSRIIQTVGLESFHCQVEQDVVAELCLNNTFMTLTAQLSNLAASAA